MCVLPRRPESGEAAEGSREAGVGQSQLECRRPVLLVGSRFRLESDDEREELSVSGAPHVAAGNTRYVACLNRQHQQPADDERGVLPGPADDAGEEVGQGDAQRRRPRQQAVQRIRSSVRPARAVLHAAVDDVDAASAERRIGFRRRTRGAQSRVSEHRTLQRRVAVAFPAVDRRSGDFADQDRGRTKEFGLLAGDRAADAVHGELLPRDHRSALSERRAERVVVSD